MDIPAAKTIPETKTFHLAAYDAGSLHRPNLGYTLYTVIYRKELAHTESQTKTQSERRKRKKAISLVGVGVHIVFSTLAKTKIHYIND